MPTFKEQQEALVKAQHELAVWEFIYAHLDEHYISRDGRVVEKGLLVPGCLVGMVPEDTIDEILTAIGEEKVSSLRARVEEIENQELVVLDKEDTDG